MAHVVDDAFVDNEDVDKSGVRSMMKDKLRFKVASVADVEGGNFSEYWGIEIGAVMYDRDTNSIAAPDGVAVLVDSVGTRFLRAGTVAATGINPRGTWLVGSTYAKSDSVSHNGRSYISINNGNIGHAPALNGDAFWQLMFAAGLRYELGIWYPGLIPANQILFRYKFTVTVEWPVNLAGSVFSAGDPSHATAVFTLKKNGTSFGTITFSAGVAVPVVVTTLAAFAAGDVVELWSPNPRDDTLADISMTIVGKRADA